VSRFRKKGGGAGWETGPGVQGMNVFARKPGRNSLSSKKKGRSCRNMYSKYCIRNTTTGAWVCKVGTTTFRERNPKKGCSLREADGKWRKRKYQGKVPSGLGRTGNNRFFISHDCRGEPPAAPLCNHAFIHPAEGARTLRPGRGRSFRTPCRPRSPSGPPRP
jgi:hypothetical protein